MKKNYIYILLIILVLSSFIIFNNKKEDNTVIVNGTKYAISIDGESASDFPTKGAYDVLIDCTNASAEWNYDEWVAEIYNVTGTTSCSINFTSREEKKLNEYITSLTGEQGNGQVVHEIDGYKEVTGLGTTISDATGLDAPADYQNYSEFYSTSYSSTSGTTTSGVFSASDGINNIWSTNTANMTSGKYHQLSFNAPSEEYYFQICYTLGAGSTRNRLYIYNGSTQVKINGSSYLSASSSSAKSGCVNVGEVSSTGSIRVIQRAYTTISSLSFRMGTLSTKTTTYDTGYRYEGKDPNNYIYFNNELWRIIGVFGSSSHGVSNTNLVKIIRNDSIGGYAWHKSNTNDWPNSSLYHLLNDYYYTATDGTSSTYCYQYSTTVTGNCDYTKIGLQTDYRNMVQTNTTWYLGGPDSNSNPSSTYYANERDSRKIYSGRSASTTGNVGLMYVSDYGYSVLSSSCARTINLGSYNTNACAGNAWLKKEAFEWTITPNSDNSNGVWYVTIAGSVNSNLANFGFASRPVLYLKSDVTVTGGDGSLASPYQIGI